MRAGLWSVVLALAVAAAPVSAAPAGDAAFDRSIAETKQAMMADPQQALVKATAAVRLAQRLPASHRAEVAMIEAQWLRGEALLGLNRLTEAAPLVDATLKDATRLAAMTKLHGDLLRSHGAIAAGQGDNVQALRDYLRAYDVFRAAGVARSQSMALQDVGLIYFDAGDYPRALDYFDQSRELFSGDTALTLTMNNNRAEVLRKQGRFADAAAAYRTALVQARKLDSPLLQVRILTNLAGALAESRRLDDATAAVGQAMRLARHGEAAGWQPFVYGIAARVAFERGDVADARRLIDRSFDGVDLKSSEMLFREYHGVAARIYEAAGEQTLALAHLKAFARLDSEAQRLTASAASQLLAARFDFANQNLKISTLKQGQLQRDVQLARQRGRLTSLALAALATVAVLLAIGFVSLRRSRNAVRAANGVLSEVNTRLESALQAKTEFLATTSHEIRTPLNGILGMTQVLLTDARVAGEVRERLEVVQGAGETMKALVDDILDVAKIESGKLVVTEEPTDLRKLLVDVGRLWTGHAERKQLSLVIDVDGAPERLVTDGARVRQIVFNLMANALKFTAAGEVTLRARTETGADGAEQLLVTVGDSGIGIPPDQQETIFEAFRQVDGGVTRQFGGTGLGLAICRNLARALGGDVTVESVPDMGSTFTVRLPVRRVAADAPAAGAPLATLAGMSFLLVGGDPLAIAVNRMAIAAEGAVTAVADTLPAAAATLAGGTISHVLCDVAVAGEDGIPALRGLAEAVHAADAQLSLLASPASPLSVAQLMMVGADQIVVGPVDPDDLVAALASLTGDDPATLVAPALLRTA